ACMHVCYCGHANMHARLPNSAHTSRPWRIHVLTPDFRLEDVRALPTPGGAGDFAGVGSGVPTLRDRLPPDLRASPSPDVGALPFRSLYLADNEWAAET